MADQSRRNSNVAMQSTRARANRSNTAGTLFMRIWKRLAGMTMLYTKTFANAAAADVGGRCSAERSSFVYIGAFVTTARLRIAPALPASAPNKKADTLRRDGPWFLSSKERLIRRA